MPRTIAHMLARLTLTLVLLAPGSALAGPDPAEPHKEGEYGGVTPGEAPSPSAKPAKSKRPPPKGTLTWLGFEAKDGGAQLFFQAASAFEIKQYVDGKQLVIHLGLTRLGPNTWRQVDTRFFDNPLAGVIARPVGASRATRTRPAHGRGISVRVSFKNPRDVKEGTVTTKVEPDGMHYAYVAFPEGADPSTSAATPPTKE
jgi:hypothetical protein